MAVLLLPAICVQVYLAISLLIFVFGPVSWPIANQTQFWSLIASYHIAFIGGYWLAVRWKPIRKAGWPEEQISTTLHRFFWPLLTIALIAMLIGCLNFGLLFVGLANADVSAAAVTGQLGVPMSTIMSMIFLGEKIGWPIVVQPAMLPVTCAAVHAETWRSSLIFDFMYEPNA